MSTIAPGAESIVIVNQVGPHSSQARIVDGQHLSTHQTNVPKPIITFYKGEPEALGVTQIFAGVFSLVLGISLTISMGNGYYMRIILTRGVIFLSGIMYILSGSFSVHAAVKPTVGKVKASLVFNIISSIFSLPAFILHSIQNFSMYGQYRQNVLVCAVYQHESKCEGSFDSTAFLHGILTLLCLLAALMFCISVSTSIFACKAICRPTFQEGTVVIYQTVSTDAANTKDISSVPGPSDGMSEIQEGSNQ